MDVPYRHLRTDSEIISALEELLNAPLIPIDTETTGLDPHSDRMLMLQLSHDQRAFVIDCLAENSISKKDKDSPVWKMLVDIFIGSATKIGHNIGFDWKIIKSHFGVEMVNLFDTMFAERLLTSGKLMKKMSSLEDIVPKYTDLTAKDMNKGIRSDFYAGYIIEKFSEEHLSYGARDVYSLFPIYWEQLFQLQQEGLIPTAELEFKVIPVTSSMEYMGVNIDIPTWEKAIVEIDAERIEKRRRVEKTFKEARLEKQTSLFNEFCSISIDSQPQLLQALKGLGFNIEDSTSKQVLERLANENPHPVLEAILEYRAQQKLVSSYGEGLLDLINQVTGRLHCSFWQMGTDTGRYSSSDPNLQNIPSDDKCVLRDCFVAPEGYVCLGADYSQQELRVLAALSNEQNMLEAYQKGEDIHTQTTAFLFKRDIDKLKELIESRSRKLSEQRGDEINDAEKEADRQRKIAKSINFLIAYGGTYKRLSVTARISEQFAQEVMNNHGRIFPALQTFINVEGNRTLDNMFSQTVLGRKRYYTLPSWEDPLYKKFESAVRRQGVNHIIQGTSADITKYALLLIHNRFTERFGRENAYIWGVIHDEIQSMVKEEHVEEAQQILTDSMVEAFERFIPKDICPMKVDAQYGAHWVH